MRRALLPAVFEPPMPSDPLPSSPAGPPAAPNEAGRLAALRRYHILDTPPEESFDRITALAARVFDLPVALVSLADESRVWVKSAYGVELGLVQRQVSAQGSVYGRVLRSQHPLVIPDRYGDPHLGPDLLGRGEPAPRFCAVAPLVNPAGLVLGTLGVFDFQPRPDFSADQRRVLADLAALVVDELELRLSARRVAEIDQALRAIAEGVSTLTGEAYFQALVQHFTHTLGVDYTHIGLLSSDPPATIKTLAVCAQGQIVDNFEYSLGENPCAQVLEQQQLCCYPSGVQAHFPAVPLLQSLEIESYAAIPFFDSQGQPLGLLGVMHRQPLTNPHLTEALLPIFALRVATEFERQRADTARQQVQQNLEQLVAQRTAQLSATNQRLQQEIAERQQAEVALTTERETLRVLLENVQAGIVACDGEGLLTLFNQTARNFHGLPERPLPPDQWAGYYDLYLPDGKTPMPKQAIPLFRALEGERVSQEEMVIAPKGSPPRTVLASGQAVTNTSGTRQGAVVVMHDITERKQIETALRDSEAQLSSIFETIPNGIVILDYRGRLVSVNSAAEKIFKLTRQQLANRTYNDPAWTITTVDGQPFAEADLPFVQVLHRRQPVYGVEHAITHADGTTTLLCINASPLFDAQGCITHVVTSISDITEQKQAEATLQASEERYRSVIETVAEGIVLQHADGSIFTCNASAEAILGLTAAQMMGRTSLDPRWSAIHEDGSPFPGDQHPAILTLRTGQPCSNVVMGVTKPDGTLTWISINTRPLFHPQQTEPFAVVASFFDITDRKRAETERTQLVQAQAARLEAEANQFRSAFLVDISTVLAASLDQTHTLAQVADRVVPFFADWCAIDLLHPGQGIERVAVAHCDPAQVALGWQLTRRYPSTLDGPDPVARVLRSGQTERVRQIDPAALAAVAQDGEHRRLLEGLGLTSYIVVPLMARGKTLGAISFVTAESGRGYHPADLALAENIAHQIAIALDNARLYQAEQTARSEAEAANRIKDEFLAVLSHELRSPLNPILGWSQLLQRRSPDAAVLQRGLETIERNAKLQTQLIADLLDVSRILQGKLSLEMAAVNLHTTVEAALETVRLAAEAKAIVLHTELADTVPPVLGDAGRLQQVVWNLLSNAVKFTPAGGRVEIALAVLAGSGPAAPGPMAQITVTDSGQGIEPEFLPYIFERFRQADSKTTRQFGGLGLGLAIARQLVELHGGTIAVRSPGPGQGATFMVELPLLRRPAGAPAIPHPVPGQPAAPPTLSGLHLLVVEDEADARDLLVFVLEQAGATVTAVGSAAEALRVLPHLALDVLISDIAMPDMDGYMLVQQIRAQVAQPGNSPGLKAVALTAYAGEIDHQRALAAGFQCHLSKPFEPAELVAAIATLVG